MPLSPSVEPKILGFVFLILAILLISGAVAGIRAGKFVLGRRFGFSPYPVTREQKPILFWAVAATLAGLGAASLFAVSRIQP
jgi:hypothetical protein